MASFSGKNNDEEDSFLPEQKEMDDFPQGEMELKVLYKKMYLTIMQII